MATGQIHGLLVQSMANRAGAQELRVVVEHDPVLVRSLCWVKAALSGGQKNRRLSRFPSEHEPARYLIIQAIKAKKSAGEALCGRLISPD